MRAKQTMQEHGDSAGWTILGTTVGVLATSQLALQVGTGVITAVAAYVAVHFTKLLLQRFAPLKQNGEDTE